MKPTLSWVEYQQLELILPTKTTKPSDWRDRLQQIWRSGLRALLEPAELQISCTSDACGQIWWSAYDPQTQRSIHQVPETEIRVWLEHQ